MSLNPNFVDGQITCTVCQETFFERGKFDGRLRWIPTHEKCAGAGNRVPLEKLASTKAAQEKDEFYNILIHLPSPINYLQVFTKALR
ncbi:hypothetical protein ACFL16_01785 [Patescibacteria group bacterium]